MTCHPSLLLSCSLPQQYHFPKLTVSRATLGEKVGGDHAHTSPGHGWLIQALATHFSPDDKWHTPRKFNIAPEKWCLEDYFPIGKVTFQGRTVNLLECNSTTRHSTHHHSDPCLPVLGMQHVPLALLSFRPHRTEICSVVSPRVKGGFGQQTISPSSFGNPFNNCSKLTKAAHRINNI